MNKFLLAASLLAASSSVMTAQDAGSKLAYPLAGECVIAYKLTDAAVGDKVSMAAQVPSNYAAAYAGASIVEVKFPTGTNYNNNTNTYSNPRYKEATVFISSSLADEPIFSKTVEINPEQYAINTVTVDEPYAIRPGETVWVGCTITVADDMDFYMPVDRNYSAPLTSNFAGVVKKGQEGRPIYSTRAASQGSLCFTLVLDNAPRYGAVLTGFEQPYAFDTTGDNSILADITNTCAADAEEMTFDYTIAGVSGTATGKTLDPVTRKPRALKPFEKGLVLIEGIRTKAEGLKTLISFTGVRVNGQDNTFRAQATGYSNFPSYSFEKAFERIPVLEEATSLGCQWCPAGHALGDYLAETYGDKFIMMAYHNDFSTSKDPMKTNSGLAFIEKYSKAMPYGIYNRRDASKLGSEGILANLSVIADAVYDRAVSLRSYADLDVKAEFDYSEVSSATSREDGEPAPTGINVEVDAKFLLTVPSSEGVNYQLSFVILEDELGPYKQLNAYSGSGEYYQMGGWENKGARVEMTFDNVVRELYGFPGIDGSLPNSIEAGKTYSYKTTLPLGRAKGVKTSVVALLTNTATGEIMNARRVYLYERDIDAIDNVEAEVATDGPVAWYTLQGIRVNEPTAPGIYIKVAGNTSSKVLVK